MPLIQIVQWDERLSGADIFAWRWVDAANPNKSDELGNWTQLVVREAQEAILFRDGQALDLFGPGRYTLSTDNIPILRRLINIPTGGESSFKAWIWFVNKASVLDVKWGTQTPLLLRDPEYQVALPVRAYGQFGVKVEDSRKFILKLAGGTSDSATITREDLTNSFRGLILSRVGDMIATYMSQKKVNIFNISAYLRDMSDDAAGELRPMFGEYGVELQNFFFGSVNVPEDDESVKELRRAMSERASMNIRGYTYQQQRSFDVMEKAAQNTGESGGLMGAGVGFGAGLGMGGVFSQMAAQMGQYVNQPSAGMICPKCGANIAPGGVFCPKCGAKLEEERRASITCPRCHSSCPPGSRFCPSCGQPLETTQEQKFCPNCGEELSSDARFCPKCGKQI